MKKRADVGGLAAIVDSLMFVCIVGAIALMVLESPDGSERIELWDRSSMVHSVLMHSTISVMGEDAEGVNHSEAPVSELLCEALGSGDRSLMDRLSDRLEPISGALIEAPWHYRWVIAGANDEIIIGESAVPDSCSIMASKMEVDRGGSVFTSILYLWIL